MSLQVSASGGANTHAINVFATSKVDAKLTNEQKNSKVYQIALVAFGALSAVLAGAGLGILAFYLLPTLPLVVPILIGVGAGVGIIGFLLHKTALKIKEWHNNKLALKGDLNQKAMTSSTSRDFDQIGINPSKTYKEEKSDTSTVPVFQMPNQLGANDLTDRFLQGLEKQNRDTSQSYDTLSRENMRLGLPMPEFNLQFIPEKLRSDALKLDLPLGELTKYLEQATQPDDSSYTKEIFDKEREQLNEKVKWTRQKIWFINRTSDIHPLEDDFKYLKNLYEEFCEKYNLPEDPIFYKPKTNRGPDIEGLKLGEPLPDSKLQLIHESFRPVALEIDLPLRNLTKDLNNLIQPEESSYTKRVFNKEKKKLGKKIRLIRQKVWFINSERDINSLKYSSKNLEKKFRKFCEKYKLNGSISIGVRVN